MRLEWEKLITILPGMSILIIKIDFKKLKDVYRGRL